jgi:tRNA-2-methylthio-N6-dimethylallyladenosine synthase
MNAHDSERMAEVLVGAGWEEATALEGADLIVFNTCSVREKAEQKLLSEVGKLKPLKEKNPRLLIAVAGCVAQQEGQKLLDRVEHLDIVLGPDNVPELPALLDEVERGGAALARTEFDLESPKFLAASGASASVTAYVTTMKGCDERCSFCIVPTTRGPERYRPTEQILEEIGRLVGGGTREVLLLGQTVDSFRDPALPPPASDDPDESQFPELLRRIQAESPSLARLRYTSPHPRHLTPSLVRAHAELEVLARHVHMPVQSGSNRVLRRMIRRYTREEYLARVRSLQNARAHLGERITVSTDLIVGFPGETEEDFAHTLSLVEEAGFTSLYAFKYSPRPGVPALRLGDDVTEAQKAERLARLLALADSLGQAHLKGLVGTKATVLLEGPSKNDRRGIPGFRLFQGRTERAEIAHVPVPEHVDATGLLVPVHVVAAHKHSLEVESADPRVFTEHVASGLGRTPRRRLPVVALTEGEPA